MLEREKGEVYERVWREERKGRSDVIILHLKTKKIEK